MTYVELIQLLGGIKRDRGKYVMCRCPAHPDGVASLVVKADGDTLMVKCHAGCDVGQICDALKIQVADLFGTSKGGRPAKDVPGGKEFVYVDERWNPVLLKTKSIDSEGRKSFSISTYNKESDTWVKGMDQQKAAQVGLLFALPDVATAIRKGLPVYFNEGEKACVAMRKRGTVGTCQPLGAGPKKFTAAHARAFKGADVVIVADRDEVGEAYATEVALQLQPIARTVSIVQSATTGIHDDAWDHFEAGHSFEDFTPAPQLLPKLGHELTLMSDVEPTEASFLWEPYLPEGKLVLMDADGGVGKTTLCLALAACFGKGLRPFTWDTPFTPIKTLYYGSEDSAGELRVVYDACGGDPSMLAVVDDVFPLTPKGLADVRDDILKSGARLVVFDALIYYLEGVARDINSAPEVAPVLRALNRIAQETGATIVCIRHVIKSGGKDRATSNLGMGSAQFRNTARGQLMLRFHPKNRGEIVVTDLKGSVLKKIGPPFGYTRRGHAVLFTQQYDQDPHTGDDTFSEPEPAEVAQGGFDMEMI